MSKNLSAEIARTFIGNSTAKLVLRCLADFAFDNESSCSLPIAAICSYLERDRKTVFRALKYLKDTDWIEVRKINNVNRYLFNLEKINNAPKVLQWSLRA